MTKEQSQVSSELQDRIDDLVRAEAQHSSPKKIHIDPNHRRPSYGVKYSEENRVDEKLKSELVDGLGLDDETSEMTLNFQNLNNVKYKLFDPEIKYLMMKFNESLREHKKNLIKENDELINDFKEKVT